MKCPNCGSDMPDDVLYCEHCGKDIHIVPDFEPDLDYRIGGFAGGPLSEQEKNSKASPKEGNKEREKEDKEGDPPRRRRQKLDYMIISAGVCLVGLLAVMAAVAIYFYHYWSYDYQLQRASECIAQGRYDEAIGYYERALELDYTDIEVNFSLAESYLKKGNKMEYEYLLREIIQSPFCNQEQLERAYGKLFEIYRDRGEYDTINEILHKSGNEAIQTAYQRYLVEPPEFSYDSGYYNVAVSLKLTSCAAGSIYYTMDGTDPGENSLLYTAPILLTETTTVKAIFINEYGVASDLAERTFHIFVDLEVEPDVSVIDGEYHVPTLIEVSNDDEADIYYTTDGEDPTASSRLYTGPIHMPVGQSIFKFASLREDGTCGKVAVRRYHLVLDTDLTPEAAGDIVVGKMIEQGKIFDAEGFFEEGAAARYFYQYQYVTNVEGDADYYVFAEIYQDALGVQERTGSFYAVNIYTGECYKLLIDKNNYSLVELIINSPEEG